MWLNYSLIIIAKKSDVLKAFDLFEENSFLDGLIASYELKTEQVNWLYMRSIINSDVILILKYNVFQKCVHDLPISWKIWYCFYKRDVHKNMLYTFFLACELICTD